MLLQELVTLDFESKNGCHGILKSLPIVVAK